MTVSKHSTNLSNELAQIWQDGDRTRFFNRLRDLKTSDSSVQNFVEQTLKEDDLWLAQNLLAYGPEANWPIHLRIERQMKGWEESSGKDKIFNLLRTAKGSEAENSELTALLNRFFALDGDVLWFARSLQAHGAETSWPILWQIQLELRDWHGVGINWSKVLSMLTSLNDDDFTTITAYLLSQPTAERESAMLELQALWLNYHKQLITDESLAPTLSPQVVKIEQWLHSLYAQIARNAAPSQRPSDGYWRTAPTDLMVGTQPPTAAHQSAINQALIPVHTLDGKLPTFQAIHPVHGSYDTRIRQRINNWINKRYADYVVGRGWTEHSNPANLHPMSRFEEIGQAAKEQVDAVFGSYAFGPSFIASINLHDAWQNYDEYVWGSFGPDGRRVGGLGDNGKQRLARNLISHLLNTDSQIQTYNYQHGAVPTRIIPSKSSFDSEATILNRVCDYFMVTERDRLLEIDRAWPATASNGQVNIQLWREQTDENNRKLFWDAFQTMIHEYLHTLVHPDYEIYADSFGHETPQYNTLMEGLNSLLTEIVWFNVVISAPTLRMLVEGPTYAILPFDSALIPSILKQRYPSYAQVMEIVNIVGIRNLYAAYFLGRVHLIGAI